VRVPDLKFNRRIGMYAHQCWSVDGEEISPDRYQAYLDTVLPQPADYVALREVQKDDDWIQAKKGDGADA